MIYEKVLRYCERNNISIYAFEIMCGIGNGTIAQWKSGSRPQIRTLKKIAAATGTQIKEWMDGGFYETAKKADT